LIGCNLAKNGNSCSEYYSELCCIRLMLYSLNIGLEPFLDRQ